MAHEDSVTRGLKIYRAEMRDVIRTVLQRGFGNDWCLTQAAPLFGRWRASQIERRLKRGKRAEDQFDVGDFAKIIHAHQSLFPEGIRKGEHHNHMPKIANSRNETWAHALRETYRADAEDLLGWCIDVLEQCNRHAAADEIRDVASSLRAAQSAALAQSSAHWWQRIPGWGRGVLALGVVVAIVAIAIFVASLLSDSPQPSDTSQLSDTPQPSDTSQLSDTPQPSDTSQLSDTPEPSDFPQLSDSSQQPIFDGIDCSPVNGVVGKAVRCKTLEREQLVRVPNAFFWRGGGNPATGNDTEFETIFEDPGLYVIQLDVQSGDEREGHGTRITVAGRSVNQGRPGAETEPKPASQVNSQIPGSEPSAALIDSGLEALHDEDGVMEGEDGAIEEDYLLVLDGDPETVDGLRRAPWSQDDPQIPADEPSVSQPTHEPQEDPGFASDDDPQTIAGRIVMRVIGPSTSADGIWRIEFGFMPEAILTAAETSSTAIEANQDLLPALRFLSEAALLARARANDQRWLRSSLIDIPASASGLSDSATGRVIARWHPSGSGAFRVEFGVLPEWSLTAVDGDLQAAATQALLPGGRFVSGTLIAQELERSESQWLASDVVEVPIHDPRPPESGDDQEPSSDISPLSSFVRCEGDPIRVFYFNSDLGTKHWLNVSADAATRILGASWWGTIGWVSAAECEQWPTGSPYDEHDVQEIASAEGS